MSVKAQALVWDLECPHQYGDLTFRPNHKYVLVAYADHADHNGKNIWPAVPTIARKTGFEDRSVQRLTHDLESMGLLVEDGQGPRGTNKWKLPYNDRGDSLSPVTICQGDSGNGSLGDSPSGDSPSGVSLSPELKEPKPLINKELKIKLIQVLQTYSASVFSEFMQWHVWKRRLESDDEIKMEGDEKRIVISGLSRKIGNITEAEVWEARYSKSFSNLGLEVVFTE